MKLQDEKRDWGKLYYERKMLFTLKSVPSGSSWKVIVRCEFYSHILPKTLDGYDILGRSKNNERMFLNDMTIYNMIPKYILVAFKDRDRENLRALPKYTRQGIHTRRARGVRW